VNNAKITYLSLDYNIKKDKEIINSDKSSLDIEPTKPIDKNS